MIEPRERLRVLEDGCRARRLPPQYEPEPAAHSLGVEAFAADSHEVLKTIGYGLRAWSTGRTFDQIRDVAEARPAGPPPQWYPTTNIGNVEAVELSLKQLKALFPDDVNAEMGDDDSVSSFFGGAGVGIGIERIKGSHVLILDTSYDDC